MKNKLLNADKDSCWVCGARFRCATPPGPANLEQHHVVPRNAGGLDGPVVNLCDTHHGVAHKLAQALRRKADTSRLLLGSAESGQKRLLWLAAVILRAEDSVAEDPSKMYGAGLKLNADGLARLAALQKALGKSRQEVLEIGLNLLYQVTFKGRK